jgi:hypothetical protein
MDFDDRMYEYPERAQRLTSAEAASSVADEENGGAISLTRLPSKDPSTSWAPSWGT